MFNMKVIHYLLYQKRRLVLFASLVLGILMLPKSVFSQTEVMAWGNITGIRVEGQLFEFESSIRVVGSNWISLTATGKEKQQPKYHRDGDSQIVKTELGGIQINQTVKENGRGSAMVSIDALSLRDTTIDGVYFCIDLPAKYYSGAIVQINGSDKRLSDLASKPKKLSASSLKFLSDKQQLEIKTSTSPIFIRKENGNFQIYIGILDSKLVKGTKTQKNIILKSTGVIDKSPAEITMDVKKPGDLFAGFGGNFRLQNPTADPKVTQYCLDNMRVAWGRVEMPWNLWQPDENVNPIDTANSDKLHEHVQKSMLMTQELAKRGIPIIISDWQAPTWAIIGDPADAYRYRHLGRFGYPLNPLKLDKIYQSIGDYLVYLKQNYGVEPVLFSFNESDLGINIRHTGQEHAEFIKGLGAHFASRGIKTKMLLGDNSDATTFDFILPAMNDPETYKYIGAVSFHSWRGCDNETLQKWAGAAKKMNLPLIIAEGSTDAAAHSYAEIFYEQTFALYEINLYMRLCALCQPLSIIQWQLTSDYSVLKGEGIYGTQGPLTPTRRFWNLKQLASTPENSFSLPVTCNKEELNCAVFGNIAKGEYAVHMVNNGAEREVTIKGIPDNVNAFEVFITDGNRGMEKSSDVPVNDGEAVLKVKSASFTSLLSK
jgi:hypothetical protein